MSPSSHLFYSSKASTSAVVLVEDDCLFTFPYCTLSPEFTQRFRINKLSPTPIPPLLSLHPLPIPIPSPPPSSNYYTTTRTTFSVRHRFLPFSILFSFIQTFEASQQCPHDREIPFVCVFFICVCMFFFCINFPSIPFL